MRTTTRMLVRNWLLSIGVAVLFAGQAAAKGFDLDTATEKKIDAAAQRLIDGQRSAGVAIGIMSEGKIVYAKGFGAANLESGGKVTPDSVFLIGSITKPFTAASIMLLAEQGKLKIDDPLSKYIPDFPRGNEVTLRQLLSHTSGIHGLMGGGSPQIPTPEQAATLRSTDDVVDLIKGMQSVYDFDPGTSWRYSNSGFWLLGSIVEQVSGLTLREFMKEHFFDRAGMKVTDMDEPAELVSNRVNGYTLAREGGGFMNARSELINVAGGAGGLHSTIGDLLLWQRALLSGAFIPAASLKEMTTPARLKNGEEVSPPSRQAGTPAPKYGLGWSVGNENGHVFFGHTGGNPGFSAELNVYPEDDVAFVVLTNTGLGGGPPRMRAPDRAGEGGRRIQGPGPDAEPGPQRRQGPGPGPGPQGTAGPGPDGDISQRPTVEISQLLKDLITKTER